MLGFGHRDIAGLFQVLAAAAVPALDGTGGPAANASSTGPKAA